MNLDKLIRQAGRGVIQQAIQMEFSMRQKARERGNSHGHDRLRSRASHRTAWAER